MTNDRQTGITIVCISPLKPVCLLDCWQKNFCIFHVSVGKLFWAKNLSNRIWRMFSNTQHKGRGVVSEVSTKMRKAFLAENSSIVLSAQTPIVKHYKIFTAGLEKRKIYLDWVITVRLLRQTHLAEQLRGYLSSCSTSLRFSING